MNGYGDLSVFSLSPMMLIPALLLDIAIGDPRSLPHPVRIIGNAVNRLEQLLGRIFRTPTGEKAAGALLVILIVVPVFFLTALGMKALISFNNMAVTVPGIIIIIYLTSTTIAVRELIGSAGLVIGSIRNKRIEEARQRLGMIVGRDTSGLSGKKILRATIETLSENLSDGVVAPLFYLAIGGLPLALAYKAVNTLDSMVGYRDERYINLGLAAARLDDAANYIPARITGLLIVSATFILDTSIWLGRAVMNRPVRPDYTNSINAFKIMRLDGRKHSSPNSGVPEAAMAGALGVKLGGASVYGGVPVDKPYIGSESRTGEDFYLNASEEALGIAKITCLLSAIIVVATAFARSSL
ncbi:MAG: adenosylcobinamide-phosphate synthase CbiB [Nitrospirota bacterium]|nr:adenosylcobinamide-phosphate synthase CbiB [Nitrospirota bacterium]